MRRCGWGTAARSALVAAATLAALATASDLSAGGGTLLLRVTDGPGGPLVPCRIHLRNQAGVPRKVVGQPFFADHFVFPGEVKLELPRGTYTFDIERGLEYARVSGHFQIVDFADDEKTIELKRACDLAAEGWWAGDLDVARPQRDLELLIEAEDLHFVAVAPPAGDRPAPGRLERTQRGAVRLSGQRYYEPARRWATRGGDALWCYRVAVDDSALVGAATSAGGAASAESSDKGFANAAARLAWPELLRSAAAEGWLDVERGPLDELPAWLASGAISGYRLLPGTVPHQVPGAAQAKPATARGKTPARDPAAAPLENQETFFRALDAGLRLTPTAGSGSGREPNPLGSPRMYAWVDPAEFSDATWWRAVAAGRVVVTNGPLIRPLANGRPPGHVFRVPAGDTLEVDIAMNLTTRDPLSYLEIIRDGRVAVSLRLDAWAKTGHFPPLEFDRPGWFLVRVVTDEASTYRAALSGAWYVEVDGQPPRVSRRAAEHFLQLVERRITPTTPDDVRHPLDAARRFWQTRRDEATAD